MSVPGQPAAGWPPPSAEDPEYAGQLDLSEWPVMDGDTVAANPSTAEPEPLEQVNVADPLTIRLSIDDTMKLPVDSERARQDPPTVQIPAYP
ncbi:MAG: hypothetical protein JO285_14870, partial [Kutzneria sp.]|nr:hypothetical protein [Kutzneria sp.]